MQLQDFKNSYVSVELILLRSMQLQDFKNSYISVELILLRSMQLQDFKNSTVLGVRIDWQLLG